MVSREGLRWCAPVSGASGRAEGGPRQAPSRRAVRSHAHGAVLPSLRSADPGSGVQRGSQAEARGGAGTSGSGGHGNIPG